ncbi:YqaE/Pmp3 family membrane protein [Methylobacterium oryzihabitans]|uniref:YqaE/Pmp3 family membrane protein n=1 Tax=Methylobacterium oryzihabitans TaxID=2499852 RepID=UPI001651E1FA|nr:YqaE/Pmp3 family membrane protein [Methylobacterium oryzihabitans]
MSTVAVVLPWLALMQRNRPVQALMCFLLQITVIGWPPGALWAVTVVHYDNHRRRTSRMRRLVGHR